MGDADSSFEETLVALEAHMTPEDRANRLVSALGHFVSVFAGYNLLHTHVLNLAGKLPEGVRIPGKPSFQFPVQVNSTEHGVQTTLCLIESYRLPEEHAMVLFQVGAEAKRVESLEVLTKIHADSGVLLAALSGTDAEEPIHGT